PSAPAPARDRLARVNLQNPAPLDPTHPGDPDPALEPGEHLAGVVLEPLQRADRALAHDLGATAHAYLRVADDLALRHERAAHRAAPGNDEDLAHLPPTERRLADLRCEHAGQGCPPL